MAGGGTGGDGPATDTQLENPSGVAVDRDGNLYVTDFSKCRVGKVAGGVITTVAGNGNCRYGGDGGPATSAGVNPVGVAVDAAGSLYIVDFIDCRVRKVTDGIITTIAGNGTCSGAGDGGPPLAANFAHPFGVAVDGAGTVYIADKDNCRVRQVRGGTITAVAGTRACGYAGDGGPTDSSNLDHPVGVTTAGDGALYIADTVNCRIRVVRDGTISTVAGNGTCGFGGDGGLATDASLNLPYATALDAAGDLVIADRRNCRIRKVSGGIITTIAGNGDCAFGGDGGPATSANLDLPDGVAIDGDGNLYISDHGNHRVRKVDASPVAVDGGHAGRGREWLLAIAIAAAIGAIVTGWLILRYSGRKRSRLG